MNYKTCFLAAQAMRQTQANTKRFPATAPPKHEFGHPPPHHTIPDPNPCLGNLSAAQLHFISSLLQNFFLLSTLYIIPSTCLISLHLPAVDSNSATPIRQPGQLVVQELIKIGLALHALHVALAGFGR